MSKLLCPFCESKVYDNRKNKKNPKSPDFVCSNNDSDSCDGHTGKYRKAWWLNSRDLPSGWINEGLKNKENLEKTNKPNTWVSEGMDINNDFVDSKNYRKTKSDPFLGGTVDEDGFFDHEAYERLKSVSPCNVCFMHNCKEKNNCQ